jgi:SAM-dependent methyltransferase
MKRCSVCGSPVEDFFKIPYAFFRHLDFEIIKHGGVLSRCGQCSLVENQLSEEDIKIVSDMFQGEDYLQCQFMTHTLSVSDKDAPVSRTSLQAKLLRKKLDIANPSVLEIGCFHGELLGDLNACYESIDLHGYDINEGFRDWFPAGENFHYWSESLAEIDYDFDIIIMSGSIMYIQDISDLMLQLKRMLRPEGVVFVQAVDISKNPYAILLGDQHYHYTPTIMRNLFLSFGFSYESLQNELFPKELMGFARINNDTGASHVPLQWDDTVSWCINTIDKKAAQFRTQAEKMSKFGVLGTTSAAAFVDSLVETDVSFFVDENPNRVGLQFHGKNIIHPSELCDEDVVVIPYGDSSEQIKARFSSKYKGHFICF